MSMRDERPPQAQPGAGPPTPGPAATGPGGDLLLGDPPSDLVWPEGGGAGPDLGGNALLGQLWDRELPMASEELYYRGLQARTQDRPQIELLSFMLAGQEYALGIRGIREIIRVPRLTVVPRVAPFLLGVISLRGGIVPVIDLKLRVGLGRATVTRNSRVLVALRDGEPYGLLVDEVRQVVRLPTADLEPPPLGLSGAELEFLEGIGRFKNRMLILLDLDPVLSFRAEERFP